MKFVFRLSRYEEATKNQLLCALQKVAEKKSRHAHPNLWKVTDSIKVRPKVSKQVSAKRRTRYRFYGVIILGLGIFATLPGLMAPKELLPVLIVGIINIVLGLTYLIQPNLNSDKGLRNEAQRIWSAYQMFDGSIQAVVEFRDQGIYENDKLFGVFSHLSQVIFGQGIFLFVWNEKFLFLQQKDLHDASTEQFLLFIKSQVSSGIFAEIPEN